MTGCEEANQRRSAEFVDKLGIVRKEGHKLSFSMANIWSNYFTLPWYFILYRARVLCSHCLICRARSRNLCRCSLAFGLVVDFRPPIPLLPRLKDWLGQVLMENRGALFHHLLYPLNILWMNHDWWTQSYSICGNFHCQETRMRPCLNLGFQVAKQPHCGTFMNI